VTRLVLSGTPTIVPPGTRSSCYRGPDSAICLSRSATWITLNFPNSDSFGICLTDDMHPQLWIAGGPEREQLVRARRVGRAA
jgi:hypothetical protein